jgi:hypothetical protein
VEHTTNFMANLECRDAKEGTSRNCVCRGCILIASQPHVLEAMELPRVITQVSERMLVALAEHQVLLGNISACEQATGRY